MLTVLIHTLEVEGTDLLAIRLSRIGAKKRPHYRIVVLEKDAARDGRYLEVLGTYNPRTKPAQVKLNRERYDYWRARGAQPSQTVESFLKIPSAA